MINSLKGDCKMLIIKDKITASLQNKIHSLLSAKIASFNP